VRPSDRFLLFLLAGAVLVEGTRLHALHRRAAGREEVQAMQSMVRRLGLTDLSLFVEARYARHPSQADRFAPFQDHPTSLEHFPSGSLVPPP
jgi:hypothetical protein